MCTEDLLKSLSSATEKWQQIVDVALLSHNLYVATTLLATAIAFVDCPDVLANQIITPAAVAGSPLDAWRNEPSNGGKMTSFLAACNWQEAALRRHGAGALRGERATDAQRAAGLHWSPTSSNDMQQKSSLTSALLSQQPQLHDVEEYQAAPMEPLDANGEEPNEALGQGRSPQQRPSQGW